MKEREENHLSHCGWPMLHDIGTTMSPKCRPKNNYRYTVHFNE